MKDLAFRNFTQIAVSEGDTSPNPGFDTIAYSTTLGLLVKWNGSSWQLLTDQDSYIYKVDWIIGNYLSAIIFNDTAMTIDFSTILTSTNGGTPVTGQTVWISTPNDYTKLGVYVIGSVASLSAVPITRHPDWPADRYVRKGTIFKSRRFYIDTGTYDTALATAAYTATDVIDIPSGTATGPYGRGSQPVVRLFSTGSMPGGVTSGQWYWTRRVNSSQCELHTANDYDLSSLVNITSTGSGSITLDVAPTIINKNEGDDCSFIFDYSDRKLNDSSPVDVGVILNSVTSGNALGSSSIAVGVGSNARGEGSVSIGYSTVNDSGSLSIQGTTEGAFSQSIGYQSVTEGDYSLAIGTNSRAINDNMFSIYCGNTEVTTISDAEYITNGLWHFEATTTDATQTTCYVKKSAVDLSGVSDLHGAYIRSGYYFLQGKVIAHNSDRTKFTIWNIKGTVERSEYSNDPILAVDFIPENSSGGSEELSLKIVPFVITPSKYEITFKVTGAVSTSYYWNIELQFLGHDGYDYSAYAMSLSSGKKTIPDYIVLPASESITAGAPVNIWNDSGTTKVRNANASNGRQADGFVGMNYGTGDSVVIFLSGNTSLLSGLTIGPIYLGTSSGTYTSSAPGTGNLVQRLGFATTTSNIVFIREPAIQT